MMKLKLLVGVLFLSSFCWGQTLQKADELYENFQFTEAAEMYAKAGVAAKLSEEQLQRLAYCYFIENNAASGLPFVDSNLQAGSTNGELWYYKAHFEREVGKYDEAVQSAEKYLAMGGRNLPLKFRESCYILKNTPEFIDGEMLNHVINDNMSNSINHVGSVPVYFFEIGVDSLGNKIGRASTAGTQAEMFLMKPFLVHGEKVEEWIILDEKGKELSINSIQFDSGSKKVYFAAAMPGSNDEVMLRSHIYEADLTDLGSTITEFRPWVFSGIEDTSSCAHVSLSSDGNIMVFSKLLNDREDVDLYYSRRTGSTWSDPEPVPGINTRSQEIFPVIQGDTIMYFSSDGHIGYGGLDIFSIPFTSDWSHDTLTRLPLPLNSTSDDFNYRSGSDAEEAFLVSNRKGGKGDDDVWNFRLPKKPEPVPVVVVEEPKKPEFDLDAFLRDCNSKRIYFAFNQGTLEERFDFVEKLNELEEEGYRFSIIVTGYADARGTIPANYQVGMKRAEAVKKDLISRGIEAASMKCVSMGSTKIENRCKNPKIQCSEEEHRLNRYVQLTISVVK